MERWHASLVRRDGSAASRRWVELALDRVEGASDGLRRVKNDEALVKCVTETLADISHIRLSACGRELLILETGPNPVPEPVVIDIEPGDSTNAIYLKGMKTISVAILSATDFDAPSEVEIDQATLPFGVTGDEQSLISCATRKPKDVNRDGIDDLVCKFSTTGTGFQFTDTEGILKGMTTTGSPFEGRDTVLVLPRK